MIFRWLKRRRRARLLAEPAPAAWGGLLERELEVWRRLPAPSRARLLDITRILVAEKRWEGAGGFEISDEVPVIVAAQAGLLLLGIEHDYYPNVRSVVIYPAGYRIPGGRDARTGLAGGTRAVLGTAHYGGPVVLSWRSALAGGRDADDARNLVLHEFAHKLDMLDGTIDGTPPLPDGASYRSWFEVMSAHFEGLQRSARSGRRGLLDAYGATDVAEFFAVATETFFEKPRQMGRRHPELYAVLQAFFRQDPAAWRAPRG